VVLKRDHNDNSKPDKTSRENKIDPIISMCEALGTYLDENGYDVELV
jgi:phage terminase large subunit-like protein